jgi:hypothetical protein
MLKKNMLKKHLEIIKKWDRPLKPEDLIPNQKKENFDAGDIFFLAGKESFVYSMVIGKYGDLFECIILADDPFLVPSSALKLKVDHFIDEVYVTSIYIYFPEKVLDTFGWKVCKLNSTLLEKIKSNVETLEASDHLLHGPRKAYNDLLVNKIKSLYDYFLSEICKED